MAENNAYILGTDKIELHRLGLQHQVWASEAQLGWINAGFTAGQDLLDLGCGPGFCTKELAFICGHEGSVTGVDKSEHFISFLESIKQTYQLPITAICSDFDELQLGESSLDGMYSRWALAWISNPREILIKIKDALKPGGRMVLHEYYDWSTLQTEPRLEALNQGIAAALLSLKEQDGEIDIGRYLPIMLEQIGMKVTGVRLMHKLARPGHINWQWPKTFFYSYFPRLVETGYLSSETASKALEDMEDLELNKTSTLFTPMMVEVIAEKP